ncbi:MAG: biopolymer transporter ExbD [Vicinamibacteria bacterium]|nr:biopolymer transporter ExbD [Vicinamibacteria bacterium]
MAKVESLETQQGPRRGRGRRVTTQLAEINVVPLVDVMLVLLIIFMVATPMMQRGVDVSLPVARRAAPLVSERLFVTVPLSYRKSRIVYIDDDPIRVDILEERVRQALLNKTGKEVFLRGDGGVQLQDLLEVMDRLKNGGVEKVGIVAKMPGER